MKKDICASCGVGLTHNTIKTAGLKWNLIYISGMEINFGFDLCLKCMHKQLNNILNKLPIIIREIDEQIHLAQSK